MSALWYAVQVWPQLVGTASFNLKRQGFDYLFPRMVVKTNKKREVLETVPLFKGYGFVCLDVEVQRWLSVNYTRGVVRLLPRWSDVPHAMPAGFVEYLAEHDPLFDDDVVKILDEYVPGCEVRVVRGVLEGRIGSVVAEKGRFVEVVLSDLSDQGKSARSLMIPANNLEQT